MIESHFVSRLMKLAIAIMAIGAASLAAPTASAQQPMTLRIGHNTPVQVASAFCLTSKRRRL